MSQMFLFHNLTQGRGLFIAGINPTCAALGQDPGKGCAGTKETQVALPLGEEILKAPAGGGNKQFVKLLDGPRFTT